LQPYNQLSKIDELAWKLSQCEIANEEYKKDKSALKRIINDQAKILQTREGETEHMKGQMKTLLEKNQYMKERIRDLMTEGNRINGMRTRRADLKETSPKKPTSKQESPREET
jgi:chromosome segregation ATPase